MIKAVLCDTKMKEFTLMFDLFIFIFFFFNDTATTEIYTLSLHDALPIYDVYLGVADVIGPDREVCDHVVDRKSTRLNSSHQIISYAVFCLKKKNVDRKSTRLNSSHQIISYAVFCLKTKRRCSPASPSSTAGWRNRSPARPCCARISGEGRRWVAGSWVFECVRCCSPWFFF